MFRTYYIQAIGLLLICALVHLAGCSGRELDSMPDESLYGEVYLNISLSIDSDDSRSRAGRPDEDENLVDGVGLENAINTLHLFWKESGQWKTKDISDQEMQESGDKKIIKIKLDEDTPDLSGIAMCLGANLSEQQVTAFMSGNGGYVFSGLDDWSGELAPMCFGSDDRNDIAMFCTEQKFPISNGWGDYTISFRMKRLVAKVLVTCKESGEGFVNLKSNPENKFYGWIKSSEVFYTLNGVNKSTFIMQKVKPGTDYDSNVEDMNTSLEDYTSLYATNENEYLDKVNSGFYYSDVKALMQKDGIYRQVEVYDGGKDYNAGMYCPENTFFADNISVGDEDILKSNTSAWGMITGVSIKAKFTPRYINVEGALFDYIIDNTQEPQELKDVISGIKSKITEMILPDGVYKVDCGNENITKLFLKYSLEYSKFLTESVSAGDGFPDETYFYHSIRKEYYTYGAAKIKYGITDNTTELGNYLPYYDGWGFYYTYIDNRLDKPTDEPFTFYKHGQVERNRYYLITVNSFSNPGASSGEANYVEVNTKVIPWKDGGRGDITLE